MSTENNDEHEAGKETFDFTKMYKTVLEKSEVPNIEIPFAVQDVIGKIEQAQLQRAREYLNMQLTDIMQNVKRIINRYTMNENMHAGRKMSLIEHKKRRGSLLEKIVACAKTAEIKDKTLAYILAWLEEWNVTLSEITAIDIEEHHHCLAQMEMLPETFKAIESNVKILSRITTYLLEEKRKQKKKTASRSSLWKSWKERVIKRPATAHALRPDQMISDQFATKTKVSEIQDMLQELIGTSMFNKLENNAIKYISSTTVNLSKALSTLNDEVKTINLHTSDTYANETVEREQEISLKIIEDLSKRNEMLQQKLQEAEEKYEHLIRSKVVEHQALPTSTQKVLPAPSPQSTISQADTENSLDSILTKEFENMVDEAPQKETKALGIKSDSSQLYAAQGETTPDLTDQQKKSSGEITEDKISVKKGGAFQKDGADEFQSQKKKRTKGLSVQETSESNVNDDKGKQKVTGTKVDHHLELQALDKKRNETKSFPEAKSKSLTESKSQHFPSDFPSDKSQGGRSGTSGKVEQVREAKLEHLQSKSQMSSENEEELTTEPMDKAGRNETSSAPEPSRWSKLDPSSEKIKGKKHRISPGSTTRKEEKSEEKDMSVFTKKFKSLELAKSGVPDDESEQSNLEEFQKAVESFLKEKIDNIGKPWDKKTVSKEELLSKRSEVEKLGIIKTKMEEYFQKVAETVTKILRKYKDIKNKGQIGEKPLKLRKAVSFMPEQHSQEPTSAQSGISTLISQERLDPLTDNFIRMILTEIESERNVPEASTVGTDYKEKEKQELEERRFEMIKKNLEKEEARLPVKEGKQRQQKEKQWQEEEVWKGQQKLKIQKQIESDEKQKQREEEREGYQKSRQQQLEAWKQTTKQQGVPLEKEKGQQMMQVQKEVRHLEQESSLEREEKQKARRNVGDYESQKQKTAKEMKTYEQPEQVLSQTSITLSHRWESTQKDIPQTHQRTDFTGNLKKLGDLAEGRHHIPITTPISTQSSSRGPSPLSRQAQALGIPVTPQQAQAQGIMLTHQQVKALGVTLTHEQAQAPGITLTPQQAQALGILVTPQQAQAQGITLTPQQAKALGVTLPPEQAQAPGFTLTPQQAQALGIIFTPEQAQTPGITLTPQQVLALGIPVTPQQIQEVRVSLTPQQAQALGIALAPEQAQAPGITLTPQQAQALGITLTPEQAQAPGITLTPQQAQALGITLTPEQPQAPGITLTPQQAQALGIPALRITLTPEQAQALGITLTPQQAQALGIPVPSQQIQEVGVSLTPQQAQALGTILTPEQAQAPGITLTPQQAQALGIPVPSQQIQEVGVSLTPQQAQALGTILTPEQAQALGITLTPQQAQALGIPVPSQQIQEVGVSLTPQQAQALGTILTPEQAQAPGITLTPQQVQALGVPVTPQQAQALGITLTPEQAQAPGITLTPQQAQALGITLTPEQAQAPGITLTPQQAQALGITLTPEQAQAPGITLTPQQAQALGITLTPEQAQAPGITLTPQQAQALGITLTPEQAQAPGITLTPQQAQALGITLTPEQAQAPGITLTPQQAQALGITLTPEQAQAPGITLTPQQAQALGITLTPEQAQAPGITLTPQQAQALGITLTPEQAQAPGITLTPQQAQALGITLTPEQAQEQFAKLGVPLTSDKVYTLEYPHIPEQIQPLEAPFTPGEAWSMGITVRSVQDLTSRTPLFKEHPLPPWASPPSGHTLKTGISSITDKSVTKHAPHTPKESPVSSTAIAEESPVFEVPSTPFRMSRFPLKQAPSEKFLGMRIPSDPGKPLAPQTSPSSRQTLMSKDLSTSVPFPTPVPSPISGLSPTPQQPFEPEALLSSRQFFISRDSMTPQSPLILKPFLDLRQPLISGVPVTSEQIPQIWAPLSPRKHLVSGTTSIPQELLKSGPLTLSEQFQASQTFATHKQSPGLQAPSTLGQHLPPRTLPGQASSLWVSPTPGRPLTPLTPSTPEKPQKDLSSAVSEKRKERLSIISSLKLKSVSVHPSAPSFKVIQAPFTTKNFQTAEVSDTSEEIQIPEDYFAVERFRMFKSHLTDYKTPVSQAPYADEGTLPTTLIKPVTPLPSLITTQLLKTRQSSPSEWDQESQLPPINKPWVLTSVSDTRQPKMMVPTSYPQELKEQNYFVDVEAQRKNLILLNQATKASILPSQLHTEARNLIIETLRTDKVRLGYLFRKYNAYRLIQRARNNIIKRLLAIQDTGRSYETQNLYIMLKRIDDYQKKVMQIWTKKQNSLEQKRNQCLRKMMYFFSQLQEIYKLNLDQPIPLVIEKKQIPASTKSVQQPCSKLLKEENRKYNILNKFRKDDQLQAIWNADLSTSSYPITEKTSMHSLWAQLGGYPDIPMLLQLDVQSAFIRSLTCIQSSTRKLPKKAEFRSSLTKTQPRPSRLLRRDAEHSEQPQAANTQPAARTPTPRPRRRRADVRASAAVGGVRGGALSRTGAGPQRAVGVAARSRQVREAERQGPVAGLIAAQKTRPLLAR
ncbi:protein FAM186A [Ovis aries]|uniref:protein FAM186A n=1 Tax=Ovis aries TaxID=9940 RepID=UPI001C2EFB7D|nr:protein FAM186A [Ovis aries]